MYFSTNINRNITVTAILFLLIVTLPQTVILAQAPKTSPTAASNSSLLAPDKAIELAQQGQCKEAMPSLKWATSGQGTREIRKNAGIAGLRCSLTLDDRDSATDFILSLNDQFPQDPDVLFVLVHAYSDLSTRTAQELARSAPNSISAHKLNAEALEMQGKWDDAQREYQAMIEKDPNAPGLHFLLGRSLLSKPNADPKDMDRAKQEFQKEIALDPNNSAAHFVLGELASRSDNWVEAIAEFSEAAKLDANFGEAYLSWGFALVKLERYQEAIAPLRIAERLTPQNPAVHYTLATALTRTGQKDEAKKEFAIHHDLMNAKPASSTDTPQ